MIVKLKLFASVAADKSILQRNIAVLEVLKENNKSLYDEISRKLREANDFWGRNNNSGRYGFSEMTVEECLSNELSRKGLATKLVSFISDPKNRNAIENYPTVDNISNCSLYTIGQVRLEQKLIDKSGKANIEAKIKDLYQEQTSLIRAIRDLPEEVRDKISKVWEGYFNSGKVSTIDPRLIEELGIPKDKIGHYDFSKLTKTISGFISGKDGVVKGELPNSDLAKVFNAYLSVIEDRNPRDYADFWFKTKKIIEDYKYDRETIKEKMNLLSRLNKVVDDQKKLKKELEECITKCVNSSEFKSKLENTLANYEKDLSRDLGKEIKSEVKTVAESFLKKLVKEHPWKSGIIGTGLAALAGLGIYKGIKNSNKPASEKIDSGEFNRYRNMFDKR